MKKFKHLICLPLSALIMLTLVSGAFAQNGMLNGNGQAAGASKPPIIRPLERPRADLASPLVSLNVSGPWIFTDCCYNYDVQLNQDQAGNITGGITIPYCPINHWPVAGAVTGSSSFTITLTNPDGGDASCVKWAQINVTMTSSTTATCAWNNSNPSTGTGTMTRGATIVLIDPVASGLLDGNEVTEDTDAITAATNPQYVSGAAADGVTQVLVEVTGVQAGDSVQLTLLNELGQQDSEANNGGLFALGGDPDNASSTLTVTAQSTTPPMAFAVWRAPANYNRNAQGVTSFPQDATTVERSLTLQAQDTNPDGSPNTVSKIIWARRPPVVLIHGIWSNARLTWAPLGFTSPANATFWGLMVSGNYVQAVDYSAPVPVANPNPSYSSSLTTVTAAALGFAYNAPGALLQLQTFIANYGVANNVAAVQADVVAHSMGGDIARTMAGLSNFTSQNNYGLGPIHKLITIGTPHTGTQVAIDLLPSGADDPNSCVRYFLAKKNNVSLATATVNGIQVNGAVGDLELGVPSSGSQLFPIAYIAGSTTAANLAQLDSSIFSSSGFLYNVCGNVAGDPLALLLTPSQWNYEFGLAPNDGVVPVTSQLGGHATTSSSLVFTGVIHSPGFEALDFQPPAEVSSTSGIPDEVINLLNEPTNGSDFFK